jgi:hypothetical protein
MIPRMSAGVTFVTFVKDSSDNELHAQCADVSGSECPYVTLFYVKQYNQCPGTGSLIVVCFVAGV